MEGRRLERGLEYRRKRQALFDPLEPTRWSAPLPATRSRSRIIAAAPSATGHAGDVLTYRVRQRGLCADPLGGPEPTFPNDCSFRFELEPQLPFGGAVGLGRTALLGTTAKFGWDSNTGRSYADVSSPLEPVDVRVVHGDLVIGFAGNVASLDARFSTRQELQDAL